MIAFLRSWFYATTGRTIRPGRRSHELLPTRRHAILSAGRSCAVIPQSRTAVLP